MSLVPFVRLIRSVASGIATPLLVLLASVVYWHLVGEGAGVGEPWDADGYWRLWYPASLALSAFAGLLLKRRAWAGGAIVTFGQLPVMWTNASADPLWLVSLPILGVLALPPVAVSALVRRIADRWRSA